LVLKNFEEWLLKKHTRRYAKDLIRYAREYNYALQYPQRLSEVTVLPKDVRRHVMSGLANLSKFLGVYDCWKTISKNAGLKWEGRSSIDAVLSILNSRTDETQDWLKGALEILPREERTVLVFDALTGLRPKEAFTSCRLISELGDRLEREYLNTDLQMLEHFRYKDLFLRRCKNAYISFVTPELLDLVKNVRPTLTYESFVSKMKRRNFSVRINSLRKLHATMLRENLPQELVDLVQGRVSQTVFLRFYYRPILEKVRENIFKSIKPLEDELLPLVS